MTPTPSSQGELSPQLAEDSRRGSREPVRQLVSGHLISQTKALSRAEAGVGAGDPKAVHRMRTAARRLRSALSTYESLFEPGSTDAVRDDLRWLGQSLADAREAHVLRGRLRAMLADEQVDLVADPVAAWLERELAAAELVGAATAGAAVRSERYRRLLAALEELASSGPWTDAAERPARPAATELLARDVRILRRAVDRAGSAQGRDRDIALHTVRKKAKRVRYAATSASPVVGQRAARLASRATRLQTVLGDHQDSVMACAELRRYAVTARLAGLDDVPFGRLLALEEHRARAADQRFAGAWLKTPHRHVRRWLRAGKD